MAAIEPLVETKNLQISKLMTAIKLDLPPYILYDRESDELMLMFVSPDIMTVVHYVDEHVGLLYEPDTMEIVGFQVEDFEYSFLPAHASIQRAWSLRDTGVDLKDVADLMTIFEQHKREMGHEMMNYTSPWLQQLLNPDKTTSPDMVPA